MFFRLGYEASVVEQGLRQPARLSYPHVDETLAFNEARGGGCCEQPLPLLDGIQR